MMTEIETAFEAALQTFTNAQRAFDRSRSAKNRAALISADAAFAIAAEASRNEQRAIEVAFLRTERLAAVAPRRAMKAAQTELFA